MIFNLHLKVRLNLFSEIVVQLSFEKKSAESGEKNS